MEIHFQTTDHVVAVEKVAEQHILTKLCSCNTLEDISHLLIIVIIKIDKVAIIHLAMEIHLQTIDHVVVLAKWLNNILEQNCVAAILLKI